MSRTLPPGRAAAASARALPADLNRITIPAGPTTFVVQTSRLLVPFTLGLDATIVLSDLRSAERTVDLAAGTHGAAFHINHIEEGWQHAFSIRPASGPEVPVDHKAEAEGDDSVTALVLDVVAS